jgi:hypothetical protein
MAFAGESMWPRAYGAYGELALAALILRPPPVADIRRVGWSLIGTSLATLIAVIGLVPP